MRLSLRYRLLLPPAVLLVGVAAGTAWAAASAAATAERRVAGQVRDVAHTLSEPPTFPLTRPVLDQMRRLSGAEFLLFDRSGETLTTFAGPFAAVPDVPELVPHDPKLGPPVRVGADEYRGCRVTLRSPHPNEGGSLYIFYPESLRRTAVADAVRPVVTVGSVAGLAAVFLSAVTASRLVSRIRELMQRTRDVASGRFEPVPLPSQDDELRELCRSVNDMARQLAEYQSALQRSERLKVLGQFSGGLAHQLRNAAAGARLALQVCDTTDPEPVAVALRQLGRIEATLKQFLHYGRPPTADRKPCDLRGTISAVVAQVGPQARHAGTGVEWHPPPNPVALLGDAAQLDHLFTNLIGNALDAAGPGGTVTIRVADEPSRVVAEVLDTGPGPPADVAARLFEPFVTGKPEGVGLGLAVARQVVESHGGRLTWECRDGRTAFRVELPKMTSSDDPRRRKE